MSHVVTKVNDINTIKHIAIIGGGPAGLMAAETILKAADGRAQVTIYDAMATPGRKFLMAGKSGLNITHAEEYKIFRSRYNQGNTSDAFLAALDDFTPNDVKDWVHSLGIETFVGSSGRVFPKMFKGAPLLRAWLRRLDDLGAKLALRHKWRGWENGQLVFDTIDGRKLVSADAIVFAMGGASWPRLGSDGAWVKPLADAGLSINPFKPSNCGFNVDWPSEFQQKFAGEPIKSIKLNVGTQTAQGDFVISKYGVEGSAVYTVSSALRDALEKGEAYLEIDLLPDRSLDQIKQSLHKPRGKNSMSNHLRKVTGIAGVKAALLRHCTTKDDYADMDVLAGHIKALHLPVVSPRPIAEAISVAGGVDMNDLNAHWSPISDPTIFIAGEMLDFDAPTGGYLLTACLATGRAAGCAIVSCLSA